jgi:hypothetical protein
MSMQLAGVCFIGEGGGHDCVLAKTVLATENQHENDSAGLTMIRMSR